MNRQQVASRNIPWAIVSAILAFASVALLACLILAFVDWSNPFDGARFDRSKWIELAGSYEENNARARMVGDLLRTRLFLGMQKDDAKRLLGEPDLISDGGQWEYLLGMCSGMRIDYDTLTIDFAQDGRITAIDIVQH
jgi:hypothetical protein